MKAEKNKDERLEFFLPDTKTACLLPLFSTQVRAGFPSPANDCIEKSLDLNELLIKHRAATFFVRVCGESMADARIHSKDILIVDRALDPQEGQIVIAVVDGEFTVKRIRRTKDALYLVAENPAFPPLKVDSEKDFQIWGVVTYVIHNCHLPKGF